MHCIGFNTPTEWKARVDSVRNDLQKEAARAELDRLMKGGMIVEMESSEWHAPKVMAPKKSADGKKSSAFGGDFGFAQ